MSDLKKLADEITFPVSKWAPIALGIRRFNGKELSKTIEEALKFIREEAIAETKNEKA